MKTPRGPRHWVDPTPERTASPPTKPWLKDVAAVGEVLFATEAGPPPPQRMAWLAAQIEDFTARVSVRSELIFRGSLSALTWSAPPLVRRVGPLRALPFALRAKALERLEATPLGASVFAVKAMLCILYYEHPEAASSTGTRGGDR
jgi:hypothetical protein